MPEFANPVTGQFCWIELATTDTAAAKKFYGELFGWNLKDMPMPDGSAYGMADIGGKMVAGITQLPAEAKKMGAPPHWLSYVAVTDADASAKKATSLGGKVLMGPMNVGMGTMVVLQDPSGGVLATWQSHQSMGVFLRGEPGTLGWNELTTTDVDRSGKFYTNLFGWKAEAQVMGAMTYTTFKAGEDFAGGMMPQPKEMAGAPSMWGVYFSVANADATMAKATSQGAKAMAPMMDVPTVGRLGFLMDPQGVAFAIGQFTPPSK